MTARAPPPPGRPTRAASSASTKARRPGRGGGRGEPPAAPDASSARRPRTGARPLPAARRPPSPALRCPRCLGHSGCRRAWSHSPRAAAAAAAGSSSVPAARPAIFVPRRGRGAGRTQAPPLPGSSPLPPPLLPRRLLPLFAANPSLSLGCFASSLPWGLVGSRLLAPPTPDSPPPAASPPPSRPAAPTSHPRPPHCSSIFPSSSPRSSLFSPAPPPPWA